MRINSEPLPCFIDAASREESRKQEVVAALRYSAPCAAARRLFVLFLYSFRSLGARRIDPLCIFAALKIQPAAFRASAVAPPTSCNFGELAAFFFF